MIGRKGEVNELNRLYESNKAEFVAVYGRRRVGKTFLIDSVFGGRYAFRHAGLSPVEHGKANAMRNQLNHFYNSLLNYGMTKGEKPKSWLDAFFMLEQLLLRKDDGTKQVVFIDEMPWLDTTRSGFITALEAFWNTFACCRKNMMLIVCGSANSWIQDKLINNHGGLYGRLTYQIKLSQFTLAECEEFYRSNNINYSKYDITQSYMILGGVPYYMNYMRAGRSLSQNIDELFFVRNAVLKEEYNRLFLSVFNNPEGAKKIIEVLSKRSIGLTRSEIVEKTKMSDGGALSDVINALIASDFVIKYVPFGYSKRESFYKLVDPFCLFYLHFENKINGAEEHFWSENQNLANVVVWRGFAFENVCFNHIEQMKRSLGISGISSTQSAWTKRDDGESTQIDLLIQRKDNIVNCCEMKFYGDEFTVDSSYYRKMLSRQNMLHEMLPKKMSVQPVLVTTFGLKRNEYSSVFQNIITLEELFS